MRFVLFILVFFIAGCSENAPQPLEKAKELIVLTREGSTTYSVDEANGASGFDYDLVQLFAQEVGLKTRIVVAESDADILNGLKNGEAHLAAAWLTPIDDPEIQHSAPYFQSKNVLVTHEASLPLTGVKQLARKKIRVIAGSRQETALRELKKKVPDLIISADRDHNEIDLMEGVATQRYEAAVVNNAEFQIGNNYYPELQSSLQIGQSRPIVLLFSPGTDPDLIAKANDFLERLQNNGEMDRLKDRYFGHVDRLTQTDSVRFIERIHDVLPRYRSLFQAAQANTGIDWRILAALAYQESQWEPLATSPTGVRGMMMLTAETADRLDVNNRLDPAESINAGAKYLRDLHDTLPPSIGKHDRLWLALAAYNLGLGHLNAARHIAKTLKADADSWYEMKKVLPLLAQRRYYSRLKSGKGRGGEAVIMVENIRIYTDILNRHERPYKPMKGISRSAAGMHFSPLPSFYD